MKKLDLFATLIIVAASVSAYADCAQECEDAYAECKTSMNSPNAEKVCGRDYYDCKARCAEQ